MKQQYSNRICLVVNYISLATMLAFFYAGKYFQWTAITIVPLAGAAVLFVVSFIRAYFKTGFWKMVHSSFDKLDEREKQVVLNALRYSYSIFAIICIVIMYAFAVANIRPADVLLAAALLYLAHTLPGAIVGWQEKQIIDAGE